MLFSLRNVSGFCADTIQRRKDLASGGKAIPCIRKSAIYRHMQDDLNNLVAGGSVAERAANMRFQAPDAALHRQSGDRA